MNQVYLYDGSFVSLCHLIYYLLQHHITPFSIKDCNYSCNLLEEEIYLSVPEDSLLFSKIIQGIGRFAFQVMYRVFLSNEEQKELLLYYFLRNGVKYRSKIVYQRNLNCVCKCLKINQYVAHELHKMKGFLRFRELENQVLYAEMEPTNHILFDLSLHFQKRLKQEFWIIKDVKRKLFSIYDKKRFYILQENEFVFPILESESEQKMRELWKTFYQTIAIQERTNERCRKNFMPKKYWKYITEVQEL